MFFQLPVQVNAADADFLTQFVHVEVWVIQMAHHHFFHALDEFVFKGVYLYAAIVLTNLCAAHLVADVLTHTEHLGDGTLEQRQVERLKQFNINASAFNQLFGDEKAGDVIIEDLPGTKAYFNVATDRIIIAGSNIVLLEESDLEQLCDNEHLPIISRNCLEDGQSTNLFYEQVLPRYSHFATLVMGEEEPLDSFCNSLNNQIVQIGGNATIGYGYCKFTLFSTL